MATDREQLIFDILAGRNTLDAELEKDKKLSKDLNDNLGKTEDIFKNLSKNQAEITFFKESLKNQEVFNQRLEDISKSSNKTAEQTDNLSNKYKTLIVALGSSAAIVAAQSESIRNLSARIAESVGSIDIFKRGFETLSGTIGKLDSSGKVLGSLAKASVVLDKGLVGLAINAGTLSFGLLGLSAALEGSDSAFARSLSNIALFAAILTGSVSAAIYKLINIVADLAVKIGTELVKVTTAASDAFIELDKKTFVFERTLTGFSRAFGDSIGTIDSWQQTIKATSATTGFLQKDLQGAVTEIVATTSAAGFTEDQMKKLLTITTDYAAFLGGDVVQTTIEFISALNGNAQSVQKYGVKLGEAQVQQKLYAHGLDTNFSSLTEAEKIQVRYNSLLEQYKPIAGNAAAVTTTLAGQQKVFENNVKALSQAFGKGTSIVENNGLLYLSFNTILNSLNESFVASAGFLVALGARILQVGGYLLEFSFSILAVIKVIKLLNILLNTSLAETLFFKDIPVLNKSLATMIKELTGVEIQIKSLSDIARTLGSIFTSQFSILIKGFLGIKEETLTLTNILGGAFRTSLGLVSTAVSAVGRALAGLLLNPVVLGITAAVAAIYALYKAFEVIEEQTHIFSTVFEALKSVVVEFINSISFLGPLFDKITSTIKTFLSQGLGLLVAGLTKVISLVLSLAESNPFGIFAKESVEAIKKSKGSLEALGTELSNVGYNVTLLSDKFKETGKNAKDALAKIDITKILELEKELKNVNINSLKDFQKIRDERLALITTALKQEVINEQRASGLKLQVLKDFAEKEKELIKQREEASKELADKIKKDFTPSEGFDLFDFEKISKGFDKIQSSFNAGLITKEDKTRITKDLQESGIGIVKQGAKFAGLLTGGASNMLKTIASGLATVLGPLGPIVSEAVGQVIDIFGAAPVEFQRKIFETITGIGPLLANILTNVSDLFSGKTVQGIVTGLIDSIPQITQALAYSIANQFGSPVFWVDVGIAFVKGIIQAIPQAIQGFIDGFKKGFDDIFGKIGEDIKELPRKFFDEFRNLFEKFNPISLLSKLFKLDDGGEGPVEKFLGLNFPFVKFAQGGMVGGNARTSGDSLMNDLIPALLSPGEIVLPRSAVQGGIGQILEFLQKLGVNVPGFAFGGKIGKSISGALGKALDVVTSTSSSVLSATGTTVRSIFGDNVGDLFDQAFGVLGTSDQFTEIIKSLLKIGASFDPFKLIKNPKSEITNALNSVRGFLTEPLKKALVAPGLATGGLIPNGFNNDDFYARLSSGEFVVNNSLTPKLEDFLTGNPNKSLEEKLDTNNALLAKLLTAIQTPMNVNTNVVIGQESIANVILNLTRSNQRLA